MKPMMKPCPKLGGLTFKDCAICASTKPSTKRYNKLVKEEMQRLIEIELRKPPIYHDSMTTSELKAIAEDNIKRKIVDLPKQCALEAAERSRLLYNANRTYSYTNV